MMTNRRTKVLAAISSAALGIVAITACASPTPSPTPGATSGEPAGGGDVTLEFWDMSWGPAGLYDVKAQ